MTRANEIAERRLQVNPGGCENYSAAASNWEREYDGANRERLRQVKAKYDPHNVFNFEQSVPVGN